MASKHAKEESTEKKVDSAPAASYARDDPPRTPVRTAPAPKPTNNVEKHTFDDEWDGEDDFDLAPQNIRSSGSQSASRTAQQSSFDTLGDGTWNSPATRSQPDGFGEWDDEFGSPADSHDFAPPTPTTTANVIVPRSTLLQDEPADFDWDEDGDSWEKPSNSKFTPSNTQPTHVSTLSAPDTTKTIHVEPREDWDWNEQQQGAEESTKQEKNELPMQPSSIDDFDSDFHVEAAEEPSSTIQKNNESLNEVQEENEEAEKETSQNQHEDHSFDQNFDDDFEDHTSKTEDQLFGDQDVDESSKFDETATIAPTSQEPIAVAPTTHESLFDDDEGEDMDFTSPQIVEEARKNEVFESEAQEDTSESEKQISEEKIITGDSNVDIDVQKDPSEAQKTVETEKNSLAASSSSSISGESKSLPMESKSPSTTQSPTNKIAASSDSVSSDRSSSSPSRRQPSSAVSTPNKHSTSGRHNSSTEEAKEAMRSLASVQSKLKEQSKVIDSQSKTIDTLSSEKERLLSKCKDMQEELQESRRREQEVKQKMEELSAASQSTSSASNEAQNVSKEQHELVVKHLTEQVNRYAAMADEVRQKAEEKAEVLLRKLEERRKALEAATKEKEKAVDAKAKEKEEALEALKAMHRKDLDRVMKEKELESEKRVKGEEELAKTRQESKDKENELEKMKATYEAMQRDVEHMKRQVEETRRGDAEEAKEALKWKEEAQKSADEAHSLLLARIDDLQSQRDSIAAEHASLQSHLAKVHAKREREVRDKTETIENLKDQLSAAQAQLSAFQESASNTQIALENAHTNANTQSALLKDYQAKASNHLSLLSATLSSYQSILAQNNLLSDAQKSESRKILAEGVSLGAVEGSLHSQSKDLESHRPISISSSHEISQKLDLLVDMIDSGSCAAFLSETNLTSSSSSSSESKLSLKDLEHIKYLASTLSTSISSIHSSEEQPEGSSDLVTSSEASALSLPLLSSIIGLLKTIQSHSSRLELALEDSKQNASASSSSAPSSSNTNSESPLMTSLGLTLQEKERQIEEMAREADEMKNLIDRLRTSYDASESRLAEIETLTEAEKKEIENKWESRWTAKEEECTKLKRQLAARSATSTALTELQAKVTHLSDQLIAKQAIIDGLEADKKSEEEWASGVPGTASKPKRAPRWSSSRTNNSNKNMEESDGSTMEEGESGSSHRDSGLDGASSSFASSSSLESGDSDDLLPIPASTSASQMARGAPPALQSILKSSSLSEAKSRFLSKARVVGRQVESNLERNELARRVAAFLPSTLRAKLALLAYLVLLQLLALYLFSSGCPTPSSGANAKNEDPIID